MPVDPSKLAVMGGSSDPLAGFGPFTSSDVGKPLSPFNIKSDVSIPTYGTSSPSPTVGAAPAAGAGGTSTLADALTPSGSTLGLLGAGAMGLYQQNQAQKQNQGYVNQLQQLAQPSTQAGLDYLKRAQTGQLTPAQQQQQQALLQQGATMQGQAAPYLAAGAQGLQQYEQGALPQWQQQQLDNQTAAAIAQLKASLGPNVDSSTLATAMQQIQNQAQIAKGQLLEQNLATANKLYGLGFETQAEAFKAIDAGYQAAISDSNQAFQDAMQALTLGDTVTLNAIKMAIAGNAEIASSTQSLFGNLASAYAIGKAQQGASGAGGVMDTLKGLFGGGQSAAMTEFLGQSGGGGGYTPLDVSAPTYTPPDLSGITPDLSGVTAPDLGSI